MKTACLAAFYIGDGKPFNYMVRAYQRAKGYEHWRCSHVELFLNYDDKIDAFRSASSSLMDGGVRVKYIRASDNWATIPVEFDQEWVDEWLLNNLGKKFDIKGIAGYVSPITQDRDKLYCAEAVQAMLGMDIRDMSPATLFEYLLKHGAV